MAVQQEPTRLRLAALPHPLGIAQHIQDRGPRAVVAPPVEVVGDGGPGAVVGRQVAPLTAGAQDIEDAVDDLAQVAGPRAPGRRGRQEQGLFILGRAQPAVG